MILVLFIILAIIFTIVAFICWDEYDFRKQLASISLFLAILSWTVSFIIFFIVFVNAASAKGDIAANQEIYNALVYQLENNLYDNDNDVGKRELYEKITEWNSDLARNKAMQHDFWFGIMYPDIYDNFQFIELGEGLSR